MEGKYFFNNKDITMNLCIQIRDVIDIIKERDHLSFQDAAGAFYHSKTYQALQNTENTLWAESAGYEELKPVMATIQKTYPEVGEGNIGVGSTIFAVKPGDGSAREQAASCQKVLGGWANIAIEYATKRYRSNLINWGMLPFLTDADHEHLPFKNGDYIFVPDVRKAVEEKADVIKAYVVGDDLDEINLRLGDLTDAERQIILDGCLINYYKAEM